MVAAVVLLALVAAPTPMVKGGIVYRPQLLAAADYSAKHSGVGFIVWEHGKVLLERYDNGGAPEVKQRIASLTKTFWALVATAAVHEKLLSWDERAAMAFPEWRDDPRRSRIQVRHLLSMVSGLDPAYDVIDADKTEDKLAASVPVQAIAEPGKVFTYGPENMSAFGELLRRKLAARKDTPARYLERKVLVPLGIPLERFGYDLARNPMMASGAMMTARELLAMGRALVRPTNPLTRTATGTDANPMYGLTLWLNRNAAKPGAIEVDIEQALGFGPAFPDWDRGCVSPIAPPDLITLVGSGNQRLYVIPSRQLVIVRQGKGVDFKDARFWDILLGASPANAD